MNTELQQLIDLSYREHGLGGLDVGSYTVMRGLNAVGGLPTIPPNKDLQGYAFMTKPQLNLSYNNVIGQRVMTFLADPNPMSMGCAIRCMLNPLGFDKVGDKMRSALIDDRNCFLPITNLLTTMSKPPDFSSEVYLSDEGYIKEQVGWTDGADGWRGGYTTTMTFANMEGDFIMALFRAWYEYIHKVLMDTMSPYYINIVRNRVDYQTRVYRLIMDSTNTYVQKVYASGPLWPTSLPIGAPFGFDVASTVIKDNDNIQITFQSIIAEYDDPILVTEFNRLVGRFNPNMKPANLHTMKKVLGLTSMGIPRKRLLNYRLYPRIAPTMELEWYAFPRDYDEITKQADKFTTK